MTCQYGSEMKCAGGSWAPTGGDCGDDDADQDVDQPEAEGPDEVEMPDEPESPPEPVVPPVTE